MKVYAYKISDDKKDFEFFTAANSDEEALLSFGLSETEFNNEVRVIEDDTLESTVLKYPGALICRSNEPGANLKKLPSDESIMTFRLKQTLLQLSANEHIA